MAPAGLWIALAKPPSDNCALSFTDPGEAVLQPLNPPLGHFALPKVVAKVARVVQDARRLEVEPQALRADPGMGLRLEVTPIPIPQGLSVEIAGVPGQDHSAWQGHKQCKEAFVVLNGVVMRVDTLALASTGNVWWVDVHQLVADEGVRRQEVLGSTLDELQFRSNRARPPSRYDVWVPFDGDFDLRRPLVAKDCAASQVRLDIDAVGRHQVDDVLEALAFAARVAHATSIAEAGDDVKTRGATPAPMPSATGFSIDGKLLAR